MEYKNNKISKAQLRDIGFRPLEKNEIEWSLDGDRIMYNFREQSLYDADEVFGEHVKLCVVKDVEELKEMIFSYFKVEV